MLAKYDINKLNEAVAFACKDAFNDVVGKAILFGTSVDKLSEMVKQLK